MIGMVAEFFCELDAAQIKRVPTGVEIAFQRGEDQLRGAYGCKSLPAICRFGVDFDFKPAVIDAIAAGTGDENAVVQHGNADTAGEKI